MKPLLTVATSASAALSLLAAFVTPQESQVGEPPRKAVAVLIPTEGHSADIRDEDARRSVILLQQYDDFVHITGEVRGLSPGKHGFHIHEYGDLRAADGSSAGGHYNPEGDEHGGPEDSERHAGDLGNIVANENGMAVVDKKSKDLKLHFVIGRAVVVHAKPDDLTSQPSGDAGARVAIGVIGFASALDSAHLAPAERQPSRR